MKIIKWVVFGGTNCPVCGSSDTWDDNLAWGCNKCPFFVTG